MTTIAEPTRTTGRRTMRTMCPMNCNPTYCGMVVEVENDQLISIRGDRDNPDSHGFLCIRGRAAGEIIDSPQRLLRPRLRLPDGGAAGHGQARIDRPWRDATWDEALDQIAAAIRRVGPEAVAVWLGHGMIVNSVNRHLAQRFANLGGFQWWQPAIVCWGLGGFGLSLTGPVEVNTKEDMSANADLILLWGANLVSQPGTAPHIVAAKKRGARVIAIDVRRTEAFEQADETHLIRPGADAALALALINVIIAERLHDPAFVEQHTTGFDDLATHVQQYTPAWAERETGIAAETIRRLARTYAATPRSMIVLGGSSMHKTSNGWQGSRAIGCLPALTGALGHPGGGFGPRHAAQSNGMGMGDITAAARRPNGPPAISEMSTILSELESGTIKVLLLFGTNMLSSFADSGRVARAMEQIDCIVSQDLFMTDTARGHADIVLPGTSWLEESGFKSTNTHLYLMDQALTPRGDTQPASFALRGLAERLSLDDYFPWADIDGVMTDLFDHDAIGHATPADLRRQDGRYQLNISHIAHPELRFPTPSGKVEFRSEKAGDLGLPLLPVYEPPSEDARRQPERAVRYPLLFRQGRTITHFHAFYDHGQALPSLAKADPEPRLWINPADAAARALHDGDPIALFNDRGEMTAKAQVTDKIPAGVVWMRDGWFGINDLTSGGRAVPDAAALAFPAGQAAYEARIEVRRRE